jgi:hypothetical protein
MKIRWTDLRLQLRALFLRDRVEAELDEEIGFHIEMQTRKNLRLGVDTAEARRKAEVQFGRQSAVKEDCRDERRVNLVETLLQDIRYAFRGFRRTPIFALTVMATIGFGLGVNTAVFTIFNAFVLRPFVVREPWSLYQMNWVDRAGHWHGFAWRQFEELRTQNPAFSEIYASRGVPVRLNGRAVFAELVSGNYFNMLGVGTALGRTFTPEGVAKPLFRRSRDCGQEGVGSRISAGDNWRHTQGFRGTC